MPVIQAEACLSLPVIRLAEYQPAGDKAGDQDSRERRAQNNHVLHEIESTH